MSNKKKVFLYSRKSSEGEDKQMLSIPSQIKELRQLADRLGLQIVDTYEESKSAKAPGRPKFADMMERLYKGEAEGVLCWKLDRLARNPVDGGAVIWIVKDRKIEIITPSQTYSHGNENTLLMYVEFGMAQKFIDDLGKNSKRGMKTKAEMGWYPAPATVGYKNTPNKKKGFKTIIKDKGKFSLVRKLFDEILSGKQAIKVYAEAVGQWQLTSTSKLGLSRSTFYNILNNSFYYGEYEWPKGSGNWFVGKHEPMITKDEFDIVQRMLGKNGKPIAKSHEFDLTGLITCKVCGCAITASKKVKYYPRTGNRAVYVYYHCTKKNKEIKCDAIPITEKDLFLQIYEELMQVRPEQEFITWAKKWMSVLHQHESSSNEDVLKSQQKALELKENSLNRLLDLRINDSITEEEYNRKKREVELDKRSVEKHIQDAGKALQNWRRKVEDSLDFALACKEKFENGKREARQEVLTRISSNLSYKKAGRIDVELKLEYKALSGKGDDEMKKSDWLEPVDWTAILSKNPSLRPANPLWLPLVNAFKNREIEFGFSLQNIKTLFETFQIQPAYSN